MWKNNPYRWTKLVFSQIVVNFDILDTYSGEKRPYLPNVEKNSFSCCIKMIFLHSCYIFFISISVLFFYFFDNNLKLSNEKIQKRAVLFFFNVLNLKQFLLDTSFCKIFLNNLNRIISIPLEVSTSNKPSHWLKRKFIHKRFRDGIVLTYEWTSLLDRNKP